MSTLFKTVQLSWVQLILCNMASTAPGKIVTKLLLIMLNFTCEENGLHKFHFQWLINNDYMVADIVKPMLFYFSMPAGGEDISLYKGFW